MSDLGLVGFLIRWTTLTALLTLVGAVAFRALVASSTRASLDDEARRDAGRVAASVGVLAASILVPIALAKLGLQTAAMRFPDDPWLAVSQRLVFETDWGKAWLGQLLTPALLIAGFVAARRGARGAWATCGLLVLLLLVAETLSSHAMAARRFERLAVVADVLHVAGAGTWLGTLGVLLVWLRRRQRIATPTAPLPLTRMLAAFSPVALLGAALVVASGVVSAAAHLEHLNQLTGSLYGQILIAKVIGVLVIVLLGWRNWKRLTPTVDRDGPVPMLRSMRYELVATAAVLAITAVLIVMQPPG